MGDILHNYEVPMNQKDWKGCLAHWGISRSFLVHILVMFVMLIVWACPALADEASETAVKAPESNVLKIPYGFYNDSFGAAVGYVYGVTGYPQPYSTILGTVIAGSNNALACYLLTREIRLPYTERLFFDTDLAVSTFGTIQSYTGGNPDFTGEQAGSNDSDRDNYVEGSGDDNLVRANIKYLLPIGSGEDILKIRPTELERGLPVEGSPGGESWNPLESGRTYVEFRPYWREQTIDSDYGALEQKTNGMAFSLYRDNTDFLRNPSKGSAIRVKYTQDWGWFDSSRPYYVGDVEYSKYVSLGSSEKFRQRVLAFDFWTANSFSWDRTSMEEGKQVYQRPPAYQGAMLGGLWRMRGYPASRFNDQAAVYYAAEYRLIPEWNPFAHVDWIERYLGIKWWQWVPFVEVGRVAPVWTVSELHSEMKWDAGIGVRAMAKGIVGRLDIAASREGFGVNMMVGQPYQF
jgi:hypothetical protein